MCLLLGKFGVNIDGSEGFCRQGYKSLNLPMDMGIQDIIVSRLIGEEKDLTDDSLHFSEFAEKMIDTIGSIVRDVLKDTQDPIETLRVIASTLYIKQCVMPCANEEDIKHFVQTEAEDLKCYDKMVTTIINEVGVATLNMRTLSDDMIVDESDNLKESIEIEESRKKQITRS